MIHIFFIGYVLSVLIHQDFDKLGLVVYGVIGLSYRVRNISTINTRADILLLFCLYLIFSSIAFFTNEVLFVSVVFLLQFGIFYYVYLKVTKHGDELIFSWLKMLIIYQVVFVVIGLIDFTLYQNGIVSFIKDYAKDWKTDSLYGNPNPFGIMSSVLFLSLLYFKNLLYQFRKLLLAILIMGVFLSGSDMALVIAIAGSLLKIISLKSAYKFLGIFIILGAALLVNLDADFLDGVFNKRLRLWTYALYLYQGNYLFGLGTGGFEDIVYSQFGLGYGLHSMFFWLITECGALGVLIYGYFLYVIFSLETFGDTSITLLKKIFLMTLLSQFTEFFIDHVEFFQLFYHFLIGAILGKYYYLKKDRMIN